MNAVTETVAAEPVSGVEIFVPLAKLKKSPRNARKVPHGEAAIEALAASIQHKGLIQNLVVEPVLGIDREHSLTHEIENARVGCILYNDGIAGFVVFDLYVLHGTPLEYRQISGARPRENRCTRDAWAFYRPLNQAT